MWYFLTKIVKHYMKMSKYNFFVWVNVLLYSDWIPIFTCVVQVENSKAQNKLCLWNPSNFRNLRFLTTFQKKLSKIYRLALPTLFLQKIYSFILKIMSSSQKRSNFWKHLLSNVLFWWRMITVANWKFTSNFFRKLLVIWFEHVTSNIRITMTSHFTKNL